MSLRSRVLIGMAVIAVVLVVAAVVIISRTEAKLIDQVDDQLRAAELPARAGRPGPRGGDPGAGPRFSSFYVGQVNPDGTVVLVSEPDVRDAERPAPAIDPQRARDTAGDREPFTTGSQGGGARYRVLTFPSFRDGAVSFVALPLSDVDSTVDRLIAVEVIATLAVLGVLGVVAWWVIHLGIRPVKRMTATATEIAGGDLTHRVPDATPGTEAGDLGIALNQMLGRIEEAFDERTASEERLRRFVADASHELRTPVTTIRGYAELYRTGGLEGRGELDEAMRRTEQEAVRMGALVDDLLHLARLDQGRPLERSPVDLRLIAEDAVRDARAVDPERPIELLGDAGAAVVLGDEARIRQVVANLVGNALVHTEPRTPISLDLTRREGLAVLEVIDGGPGMAPDVAARAFERFYRADPARSRHRGGSGLGLSIVDATVGALGGHVALETSPDGGTTVRVELPLA